MNYNFNIGLYQDTCEPICFKFSLVLDMTKLYSMISVWMTMTFTLAFCYFVVVFEE